MKASSVLKAYLWAEVIFCAYLLVKKPGDKPDAVDELKKKVKEEIDAATQDP